jgi:c-di-GMP-binding flagellar brake protein YcgR
MNIQIGAELSVNLADQSSFTAIYIGAKDKKHIVLTIPEDRAGLLKDFKNHEKVTVQYTNNGVRYEFSTIILDVLDAPVYLVVLEYPAEIKEVDKRSTQRINCLISAKLETRQGNDTAPIAGIIENINKTGCLCIINEMESGSISFSQGNRVNITCQFPGLVGDQSANGRVVRIKTDKKDTVLGIHFEEKIWWVPPYERK